MKSVVNIPNKKLYIILICALVIIFSQTMETMIRVKSIDLYNEWLVEYKNSDEFDSEMDAYEVYKALYLGMYLMKITVPVVISLYIYIASRRYGVNKLGVFIIILLSLGGGLSSFFELGLGNIFYYVILISYIILLITEISLIPIISSEYE